MNNNQSSLTSIQTNPNSIEVINNNNKQGKTVSFNETIEIHHVESYKDHNKKLTYNEEEGLAEFYKSLPFGHNGKVFGPFNKYFIKNSVYNTNPNYRKNVDPDCCCIII